VPFYTHPATATTNPLDITGTYGHDFPLCIGTFDRAAPLRTSVAASGSQVLNVDARGQRRTRL